MVCGDISSEDSSNRFEIGSSLMWVLLTGRETGLVCLCTQLLPFQKHLQCNTIDRKYMTITAIGVPMVKNI